MSLFFAVLFASLVGSLHCAGMCGPLVVFAVGDPRIGTRVGRAWLQAAYHGGRGVSYILVGLACGTAGAILDRSGALVGVYRSAAIVAGGLMIGTGIVAGLRYGGLRLPTLPAARWAQRLTAGAHRAALAFEPLPRALAIGLLTALLPCGWLYMFAVVAAGTGSALHGAAVMAAFWAGSVPVLLAVGVSVQVLARVLGQRVSLVMAGAIVLLGVLTIALRATKPVEAIQRAGKAWSAEHSAQQVDSLRDLQPSCCHDQAE